LNTKKVVEQNPELFVGIQNPDNMIEMYDYLLSNWNTSKRIDALVTLSEKEIQLINTGYIKDEDGDGEGFFTAILDMHIESGLSDEILSGTCGRWAVKCKAMEVARKAREFAEKQRQRALETARKAREFADKQRRAAADKARKASAWAKKQAEEAARKLAEARRKAAEKVKKNSEKVKTWVKNIDPKKVIGGVNKYNPVTAAMRNAVRGLVLWNIFGLATMLNQRSEQASRTKNKVINSYKLMGGKASKIKEAITKGAKRKPHLNKNARKIYESKGGSLGLLSITGMLSLASSWLIKVWKWIKEAGLNKMIPELVDKIPNGGRNNGGGNNGGGNNGGGNNGGGNNGGGNNGGGNNGGGNNGGGNNGGGNNEVKNRIGQDDSPDVPDEKKNKYLKPALIGGGVLLVSGGIGYYFYTKNNKLNGFQL